MIEIAKISNLGTTHNPRYSYGIEAFDCLVFLVFIFKNTFCSRLIADLIKTGSKK